MAGSRTGFNGSLTQLQPAAHLQQLLLLNLGRIGTWHYVLEVCPCLYRVAILQFVCDVAEAVCQLSSSQLLGRSAFKHPLQQEDDIPPFFVSIAKYNMNKSAG